jgi:hypothetical protein
MYPDSNVGSWDETNCCRREEDMVGHTDYRRSKIDESIGQCRSDSQEKHVIQQLLPSFHNLKRRHRLPASVCYIA